MNLTESQRQIIKKGIRQNYILKSGNMPIEKDFKGEKMPNLKENLSKQRIILDLCEKLDTLYFYAKNLIPKDVEHNLGFQKEKFKQDIENNIMKL